MDKEIIGYKNIASGISVIMLLLAMPTFWPYGYYVLLRWVICISALLSLWVAYNLKKKYWVVAMGITTLLFNPIVPVYLDKETWVIIDIIIAILFLVSLFKLKSKDNK